MSTREYEKSVLCIGEAITDMLHFYGGDEDSIKAIMRSTAKNEMVMHTKNGKRFKVQITEIID